MATVRYEIVQHDNGWAYRVEDTFSETFRSHEDALAAAKQAAAEQQAPDDDTEIEWEDKDGKWHTERSPGNERPLTEITDVGRSSRRDRP